MSAQLIWLGFISFVLAYGGWLLFKQSRTQELKSFFQGVPKEKTQLGTTFLDRLINLFRPLFPGEQGMRWMETILTRANLSYTPEQVYVVSYACAPLGGALVFGLLYGQDAGRAGLMAIIFAGLLYAAPIIYIWAKASERQEKARLEYLPLLMLMRTLSKTSAGTSIDALGRAAVEDARGVLAYELRRAIVIIERGGDKEKALMEAAERVGFDDFKRFVEAVLEADQKGTPLSYVLDHQVGAAFHSISLMTVKKKGVSDKLMPVPLAGMIMPASTIIMVGPGLIRAGQALNF